MLLMGPDYEDRTWTWVRNGEIFLLNMTWVHDFIDQQISRPLREPASQWEVLTNDLACERDPGVGTEGL